MKVWAADVKSGDSDNLEARAAAYYWKNLFKIEGFTRDREGIPPNNLLNYGYAILRAVDCSCFGDKWASTYFGNTSS